MKKDQALRDVVRALRNANSRGATIEDVNYAHRLAMAYRSPLTALDADEAIRELNGWGSTDQPREISVELRYALLLYLKGAISLKRGAKSAHAIVPELAAYEARRRSKEGAIPLTTATRQVADEWSGTVTYAAIDQLLFPRRRKRKTLT